MALDYKNMYASMNLDPSVRSAMERLIQQESGGNFEAEGAAVRDPNQKSYGLTQQEEPTFNEVKGDLGDDISLDEWKKNADAQRVYGAAYLNKLHSKYNNLPIAAAAYNWGQGNVDKLKARQPDLFNNFNQDAFSQHLPDITKKYIANVAGGGSEGMAPQSLENKLAEYKKMLATSQMARTNKEAGTQPISEPMMDPTVDGEKDLLLNRVPVTGGDKSINDAIALRMFQQNVLNGTPVGSVSNEKKVNYQNSPQPDAGQEHFLGLDKVRGKHFSSPDDSFRNESNAIVNRPIKGDEYYNSVMDEAATMNDYITKESPEQELVIDSVDAVGEVKTPAVDKMQQMMDMYKALQGQQVQNTTNARLLQAGNKIAQGFAMGSGAKIDDGAAIPEGLIKDAELPAQNMYRQQTMEQMALKNKDLQEGLDPNSPISKAQHGLVQKLAQQLGLTPEEMASLSGPMSADNSGKLLSTLATISAAKQQSQSRQDALQLKLDEKKKVSEKTAGEIASYDSGINMMNNLLAEKSAKGWDTGKLSFAQNKVMGLVGMGDAEKTSFKRAVGQQLADYVRSISGTAASDSERRALHDLLPSVYDNDDVFEANAKQFINKLKEIKRIELGVLKRSGKNTAELEPDMEMSPLAKQQLVPQLIARKINGRPALFDQNKQFVKWADEKE